jgi:hypothetical protein
MSKVINYWCDSGANIHSCVRGSITLDELNLTEEQWLEMSDDDRDEIMKEIALSRLDWGYSLDDNSEVEQC